jgi:hypothetical protein
MPDRSRKVHAGSSGRDDEERSVDAEIVFDPTLGRIEVGDWDPAGQTKLPAEGRISGSRRCRSNAPENLGPPSKHPDIVVAMSEHPEPPDIECRQIAELLTDYVEGRLPQATKELIDWHIDGCAPCVAFLNTFRTTVKAVRRLSVPPPDPVELRQRLLAVLRSRSAQTSRDRR